MPGIIRVSPRRRRKRTRIEHFSPPAHAGGSLTALILANSWPLLSAPGNCPRRGVGPLKLNETTNTGDYDEAVHFHSGGGDSTGNLHERVRGRTTRSQALLPEG